MIFAEVSSLSFADFMRSVPLFHPLSVKGIPFVLVSRCLSSHMFVHCLCDTSELRDLEAKCTTLSYGDREYIISEGQKSDTVYVIRSLPSF
jgi:CRP-like cAMP-binding protein